ncbi:PEP-CTERM sorting domain-containing protein [Rubritalea spongiae]|uniref:PEP-CTERM sorting domain-containing protein n=1 Tax=Rubritalea spongiae TaxID=430797 RepID=A0ABW5E5F9_9BACT
MKNKTLLLAFSLFPVAVAPAATVSFVDLTNTADTTGNLLNAGDGVGTNLSISRSTVDVGSGGDAVNEYHFAITYTGMDFDGGGNDTLTVNLKVAAMSGNTYSNTQLTASGGGTSIGSAGSVTLDGDATSVGVVADGGDNSFGVGSNMATGETLIFSIESMSLDISGYEASFAGFTAVQLNETAGHSHIGIFGVGSGLKEVEFNNNYSTAIAPAESELFITAGLMNNNNSGAAWGARLLDFDVEVTAVPEPSSTVLLGLGGLALILRRRK